MSPSGARIPLYSDLLHFRPLPLEKLFTSMNPRLIEANLRDETEIRGQDRQLWLCTPSMFAYAKGHARQLKWLTKRSLYIQRGSRRPSCLQTQAWL